MTNQEIVIQLNKLHEMSKREKEEKISKLSILVGYAVRKNMNILEQLYKVYLESLKALQKKYLDEKEEELQFKSDDERKEYNEKLNELLNIDNPNVAIHKVSLEELKKCSRLSMEDQDALFFMIEG